VKISRPDGEVCDTCGTGGDRAGTFNISSAAAIVVAACGAKVAKHGNRSVSSRCGSADVFEQLGVNLAASPAVVERALHSGNIAFFFAPTFHPSMNHAGPTRQVVGVPRADLTDLLARSLRLLGSTRAWVLHGADGIDEISTTGHTKVSECREGAVHTFYIHPSEFGIRKATLAELLGGDAVVFNAGAALFVADRVASVREGITVAAAAIDSGAALATLEAMVRASQA